MLFRVAFCAAIAAVALMPAQAQAQDKNVCNSSGEAGTYKTSDNVSRGFYTWYTFNASSNDCLKLKADGVRKFTADWSLSGNGSDAVGGMGWDLGTASRVMKYKMTSASNLTGKLSIGAYGWTCVTKIVEYYIVDSYNGSYVPYDEVNRRDATPIKWASGNERRISSDGGTYRVYRTQRLNAGNACGTNTNFDQYWSVRTSPLAAGTTTRTISMANHVNGWAGMGMTLGSFTRPTSGRAYQVIGAEGLNTSTGTVSIDIE